MQYASRMKFLCNLVFINIACASNKHTLSLHLSKIIIIIFGERKQACVVPDVLVLIKIMMI
jgi:hypothetical protein